MATLFRDECAEPQTRCHRDRRENIAPTPPTALKRMTALAACEDLVYLDPSKRLRRKHDGFMDGLGMMSCLSRPIPDGAALKAKSGFDSGYRASVRDKRKDEHDHVGVGLEAHKGGAGSMAECFVAERASEAFSLVAVDLDIAACGMTAGRAVHIWTEALQRVHRQGDA